MSSHSFDHTHTSRGHWWVAIFAGLVTIVCGTIGGLQYEQALHPTEALTFYSFLSAAYLSLQMLLLHAHFEGQLNVLLEIARWSGAVALVWTACLLLLDRLRHEMRLLRLGCWKHHNVILGLGHKGMALVESIREADPFAKIVVIDPDPDHGLLKRCNSMGVCVIPMDAAERAALLQAQIITADEIFSVAGDDATNIRIATNVRELRGKSDAPRSAFCRVHISSSHLSAALHNWVDSSNDPKTTLEFFDIYDNEAGRVLLNLPIAANPGSGFTPIDGDGIRPDDERSVHVVIIGMGAMGTSLVRRTARTGHFANAKKVRISVIDRNADQQRDQLLFRHPIFEHVNEVCDLTFYQHQADSPKTRDKLQEWSRDSKCLLHVFVCLDNDARAVEIGLRIWELIGRNEQCCLNIRIKSHASLAPILKSTNSRLQVFGMLEDSCTLETVRNAWNEAIAKTIHDDFAASRKLQDPSRQNDPAILPWDRLREDYRESNRQQADHMPIKMQAIGCRVVQANAPGAALTEFTKEEVEMLAGLEHRRWNAERLLSGWTYGETTDKNRRIHSCIVAWDKLPDDIQEYDRETVRKIPGWLAKVKPAMKVVREVRAAKS